MNNTALADDDGFGLVEAVVSMLVLAALAVAFLPLLITGLKQSASNSTLALATQLVTEQMSLAQTAATCADLDLEREPVTDPRGQQIDVATTVQAGCVDGDDIAGTYSVTAVARLVVNGVPGDELARATTLVFVP